MKIAFLSRNLDLTPDEAIHFWPVYNELQENIRDLQRDYKIKELQIKEMMRPPHENLLP
jgi:hypothetical protein